MIHPCICGGYIMRRRPERTRPDHNLLRDERAPDGLLTDPEPPADLHQRQPLTESLIASARWDALVSGGAARVDVGGRT